MIGANFTLLHFTDFRNIAQIIADFPSTFTSQHFTIGNVAVRVEKGSINIFGVLKSSLHGLQKQR
jgi:hypothetical protein